MQFTNLTLLLEAEVHPDSHQQFQNRYQTSTGDTVLPGNPPEYQEQPNKWGKELRVYFNDDNFLNCLEREGYEVESARSRGYKSDQYRHRISNNELWWCLVEKYSFRLGISSNPVSCPTRCKNNS